MKKLQCVTSFIDIGRSDWNNNYKRNINIYLNNFVDFYSNINLDLIVFCEYKIQNEIEKLITKDFKSNIKFFNIEKNDLKYFELVTKIDDIIKNSSKMSILRQRDLSNPPEYSNSEYIVMMFAKTEILKLAFDNNLIKSDNVAWIDFGIGHSNEDFISRIKNKTLIEPDSEKIIIFKRQNIELSSDFYYYTQPDNVITPGGFYIVPTNLIDFFHLEFKKTVEDMLEQELVDDDQTILSIFASKNPDYCNIINSIKYRNNPVEGDWFPIFEFLN